MTVSTLSIFLGSFLVFTSLFKAFFSRLFVIHVRLLRILPDQPAALAALLLIELEAGLGVALILQVYPEVVVPLASGLVILATLVSWWGSYQRRIDHCGCYGAFLNLSIVQTTLINGLLILGLGYIRIHTSSQAYTEMNRILIIIGVIGVVHLMAKRSVRKPAFDLLKLTKNRSWNSGLIPVGDIDGKDQTTLYFFLNRNCPVCEKWRFRLREINKEQIHCRIHLLLPADQRANNEDLAGTAAVDLIQYSRPIVFRLLTGRIPLAVLVERGKIIETWSDEFPEEVFS